MAPIALSGLGFLLVLLRVGIGGFDVANDTVGWVLVAVAMLRLTPCSRWFAAAGWVAVVGAALSLLTWVEPVRWAPAAEYTALPPAIVLVALGIGARAGEARDGSVRRQATAIAWVAGGAAVAGAVFDLAVRAGFEGLGATTVLAAAASFVVTVWFVVLQLYLGRRTYLLPELTGAPDG